MKALLAIFALSVGSLVAAPELSPVRGPSASPSFNGATGSASGQTGFQQFDRNSTDMHNRSSNGQLSPSDRLNPNNNLSPSERVNGQVSPANRAAPGGYSYNNKNDYSRPNYTAEIDTQMEAAKANTKYPLDTAATFKDKEINDKIRSKIEGWFADDYKGVILKTDNGIVILSGVVEKEDLKNDLGDQVRKIDGVREVRNNVKANNTK